MIYILSILASIILIALDQWTKYLATKHLIGNPIDIIPNVFQLYYSTNDGAAFGIMQGKQPILVVLTTLILIGLVVYYIKLPKNKYIVLYRISLILIMGGALGNYIDRVHQKPVVDFLYFKLINFPIFNLADTFVVCGTIMFAILILFFFEDKKTETELESE